MRLVIIRYRRKGLTFSHLYIYCFIIKARTHDTRIFCFSEDTWEDIKKKGRKKKKKKEKKRVKARKEFLPYDFEA